MHISAITGCTTSGELNVPFIIFPTKVDLKEQVDFSKQAFVLKSSK